MSQILKPSGICLFLFLQRYSLFHIKGIFGVTIVFYFQCTLSIYHLSINLGKKGKKGGGEGRGWGRVTDALAYLGYQL